MGKDPAVLFYTSDFLSGTMLMSYEEKGQYISLLCLQHQIYPEHIPLNHMISVCLSHDSSVIKKFITDEQGKYYNKRMEEEISKRVSYCNSRRNNKSGRKPKKSYDNTYVESYDNHMLLHMENENENRNVIINESVLEKDCKKKPFKPIEIPGHIKKVWADYLEMRKKIKKPMTENAQKLGLSQLSKLSSDNDVQVKIVEQSIFNSWQGLFPLKENVQSQQSNYQSKTDHGISPSQFYGIKK